ncbi:hypothetical protein MCUN1_000913 [Malassezia cuniculi]|uniref:Uncharacterized protein n=1 Tax=Malassezia cuniculi TaxID=948313 RepID=A0AAF0JA97_9BASI|nr:hypothetical protein MCUN1_000913 [Malassezia cuniculi]
MPLHIATEIISRVAAPEQYGTIAAGVILLALIHGWAQGPRLLAREERLEAAQRKARTKNQRVALTAGLSDMHARVVLVATGAMTPLGVVTIATLAHQGAHVIALVPDISSPDVMQMIMLLRESTRNESIYAEQCDMGDLESISAFAARWNKGPGDQSGARASAAMMEQNPGQHRLDTLLFLPSDESPYLYGTSLAPGKNVYAEKSGLKGAPERSYVYEVLGRFHLVNALLPTLLVAPRDRDIRIVSAVSPWYAAGVALLDAVAAPLATSAGTKRMFEPWTWLGAVNLRWIALMRELQQRLDALAAADPRLRARGSAVSVDEPRVIPKTDELPRRSNISAICVCPGFERSSQLSAFFGVVPPFAQHRLHSCFLVLLFVLFYPFIWLFGKGTSIAADAIVWAITARIESERAMLRRIALEHSKSPERTLTEELRAALRDDTPDSAYQWPGLTPGALYREGRMIRPPGNIGTASLWQATEAQIEALVGVNKPKQV